MAIVEEGRHLAEQEAQVERERVTSVEKSATSIEERAATAKRRTT